MRRTQQDLSGLATWISTYQIKLRGVRVQKARYGAGIFTTTAISADEDHMIHVPANIVLSLGYVWKQAEKDPQLKEVLVALGDFAKSAKGAILTFLLVQIAATSPDLSTRVGIDNPWTTYIQFLPTETNLPTFWSEKERAYAIGTTLAPAIQAKLNSLQREFDQLKTALANVPWCKRDWFDRDNVRLSLDDWKVVDAIWRSRAMDMPSHGLCMVPVADMANHAHESRINARTDVEHDTYDVRLVLQNREDIESGTEVTITYGEEKGACEMIFSYGFLDQHMDRAESMFLGLEEPDDDPLFAAKRICFDCAPGFRIMYQMSAPQVTWIGPYVWLLCVNQEDGLHIRVAVQGDGSKKLQASWKGTELNSLVDLETAMSNDRNWDLFRMRAFWILTERVGKEISDREKLVRERREETWYKEREESSTAWKLSERLRNLEWEMLHKAKTDFDLNVGHLMTLPAVKRFIDAANAA